MSETISAEPTAGPPLSAGSMPAFAPAPAPPSERGAWLLAIAIALVGIAVLAAVLTGAAGQSEAAPAPAVIYAPTPTPQPGAGELAAARSAAILARPTAGRAARRRGALQPAIAGADRQGVDGRLLSGLRNGAADLRGQLAAARLDTHAGERLLDLRGHLPRPELRPLLRRADAVQRDQRAADDMGPGEQLLPGRAAPRLLSPHDRDASLDLRRLRRDHGRRASALCGRRRPRAQRHRLGRRLRLLRPRRNRRDLRRPGARPGDRLVTARLLHQLRDAGLAGAGRARRLRGAGARGATAPSPPGGTSRQRAKSRSRG